MADTKIPLTEAAIAALPTPLKGKNRIYRFKDAPGLAVRITSSGKRHFLYCYTADELDSRGIRIERRTERAQRLRAEQQVAAKDIIVGKLIDRYLIEYAKPRKRSWKEDESRLTKHVRPAWGARKVKDIHRADVDDFVSPVAVGDPARD